MLHRCLAIAAVLSMATSLARAQDLAPSDSSEPNASSRVNHQDTQQDAWPHPELSANDGWARDLIWFVLLAFFLPAAILGPLVRKRVAAELPELHDREENDALTASQHEPGHSRPS